jgi:hypothetical protein
LEKLFPQTSCFSIGQAHSRPSHHLQTVGPGGELEAVKEPETQRHTSILNTVKNFNSIPELDCETPI